ncbi:MAG: hypothetical protein LHW44_03755 [Candidatus Cloacimonetes bacterium]|nr:hypothetical protein [Candidatus Cloacimonadota bacterium]
MKWAYSVLFILLCGMLVAQTSELPVVEIMGDAQVKIPLAKRSSLPFTIITHSDSLGPFFPVGIPPIPKPASPYKKPLKGWFSGRVNTDWNVFAQGSLYNLHRRVPHLRVDLENRFLPDHFKHMDHQAFASLVFDDTFQPKSRLHYQHSSADQYVANALYLSASHHADSLSDKGITLHQVDTRLWWENTWQRNASERDYHLNPGFWNSHRLQYEDHLVDTHLGSAMGRFAIASAYHVTLRFSGLMKASLGLMSDLHHVLPQIQVHYERPLSPSLLLQAGNYPGMQPLTRSQLMQQYPWGIQPTLGSIPFSPLDMKAQITYTLPPIWKDIYSHQSPQPLNNITGGIRSAYTYNQPVLKEGNTPIPIISLEPAWNHSLSCNALFRLPWGVLRQELAFNLNYLPHQGGIRAPYSPRFISQTSFSYQYRKLVANLILDQCYNQKDHQKRNLPEVIDLSLTTQYRYSPALWFEGGLQNILNKAHIQWEGLPTEGRKLYLQAKYIWN